jgi:putative ABC transport system ATP-binding protein
MRDIKKKYHMGEITINALAGINLDIERGEFAAIVGSSGSGKTTVLNILGGLDVCTSGIAAVDGKVITAYSAKQLTAYRRNNIGFVFQFYNLMPNLTALENVELATQICRGSRNPRLILDEVGLKARANNFPSQLSGGEQQRVAIARALAKNPKLLLCDEPTGALDDNTGRNVLGLLHTSCRERNMTVIVITHNQSIIPIADRVIILRNGIVSGITQNRYPRSISEIEW